MKKLLLGGAVWDIPPVCCILALRERKRIAEVDDKGGNGMRIYEGQAVCQPSAVHAVPPG